MLVITTSMIQFVFTLNMCFQNDIFYIYIDEPLHEVNNKINDEKYVCFA